MEKSDIQLSFLDIIINKEVKKIMHIYSKPTDSKRYVSFKSNYPKYCLKNIPLSLARRICKITGATLPRKKYKSRYKHSFKNTPKRIEKCKGTRKKEDLTFYFKF